MASTTTITHSPLHRSSKSLGAGSPPTTNSSIPQPTSQPEHHTPRSNLKRRSTNPLTTALPLQPPASSSSPSPSPLRRSLSFKVPIRISTDSSPFPSQNRARAQSLPQAAEAQPPSSSRRHSKRFSLISIGELTTAQFPLEDSRSSSPTLSQKSLEEQFLLDRGLNPSELADDSKTAEELQNSLQERVVKYLTSVNMSSPNANTKAAAPELDRAPSNYQPTYQGGNAGYNSNNTSKALTGPGLPMPGLSGPPNGPIGNLLKGAVGEDGKLKDAGLMVGIKLDLEAEVHLTARVRGDILVGLY
ncbi:hypothetical protein F5X68DRAFT_262226 [Plectosphaerella plurivora]|uniref:Uncharacterized protein n=1 Tax=Plectosphaerella plurivora TaxID=936078 RepID=A0A9P8VA85_9PEZI|nr:hypothetical protein F5X68DRAFT_262226 [Plectosphaerella plurivora]